MPDNQRYALKKIDKLVITSIIPPFVLAFFIAVFVLIMQFLWSFIDELVGKGINAVDLAEMLFYRSLSLFPLAFPIGILLSSVMVYGGLSERYELSSLKSAGVSLLRVMMPGILFAGGIALFSIFCSNTLIPLSNLKFQSRLYDMRNQKPALSLIEGIFNDDFKGYSIHIGNKENDNRTIEDVVIYDQTTATRRQFSMVTANSGEMFLSADGHDFVMKLYDGYHYQEVDPEKQRAGFPFTRTQFGEWTKKFSLSEFDLSYTDEELFKTHHSMKSVSKLIFEVDTIDAQYDQMLNRNLYDFNHITQHKPEEVSDVQATYPVEQPLDSLEENVIINNPMILGSETAKNRAKGKRHLKTANPEEPTQSELESVLDSADASLPWDSMFAQLSAIDREQNLKQALSTAKSLEQNTQRLQASLKAVRINRAKHVYELHSKFSFGVICIIFLFIGAPMGAIVRKGGFGYPLLVSVIFFTIFILLSLMFKKLSETESVDPIIGAWMPCIAMLPVSALLTYKALNDVRMLNPERLISALIWIWDRIRRKKSIA